MGQICSICGFKEKPQQATANVESSLRGIQASHQSQQLHASSPLFNMTTNLSNSANAPFFLYTVFAIVPQDATHVCVHPSVVVIPFAAFYPVGVFEGRRRLKEVVLPDGLTAIGARAFYGCNSLERINFPSTLTAIGYGAFAGCTPLREADLSNVKTIGHITIGGDGYGAFEGCASLREVDLSNVITIGRYAFRGCTALERINFPSTVTAIGAHAFRDCVSLREVKLVGGILDIGECAFYRCSSLIRFQIPSKAFVIETDAYNYRFLTDGTITPMDDVQVVIASKCLKYMSVTGLAEVENRINAITNNREQTRDVILERIRALFAYYELVEATTILELALWKAKVDEVDDLNAREECRFTCGAGAEKLLNSRLIEKIAMEIKPEHLNTDKRTMIKTIFDAGYELYMHGARMGPNKIVTKGYKKWEDLAEDFINEAFKENVLFRLR